jgi:opacity protein-like surface antigen
VNHFQAVAIVVMGAMLLMLGTALPANAEVIVSAKGGLHSFENTHYRLADAGFNYGFAIQYLPPLENRTLDVGVEVMIGKSKHFSNNVNQSTALIRGTREVSWNGILMTAHYRPPVSTSIQPYVGGGVGLYQFTPLIILESTGAPPGIATATQSRTGFNLDAGVDFRLGPHWIVGLEYRYISANVSSKNNPSAASWVNNLNFMTTQMALRYAF